MAEIERKQVCKCDHCGNEAEMVITCSLDESNENSSGNENKTSEKIKGTSGLKPRVFQTSKIGSLTLG